MHFIEGALVEVIDRSDRDWWKGRLGDSQGTFPSNHVALVNEDGRMRHAVADFDFEAKDDNELSFSVGAKLEVLHICDTGWWEGRLVGSDHLGLFPSNRVHLNE